jgi:hypothetical protein
VSSQVRELSVIIAVADAVRIVAIYPVHGVANRWTVDSYD